MSNKPVLYLKVNEEMQLRLFEERHVEDYFALISRNKAYLHEWIAVEAYEGPVETLKAYVKQRLLQFVEGSGYQLGSLRNTLPFQKENAGEGFIMLSLSPMTGLKKRCRMYAGTMSRSKGQFTLTGRTFCPTTFMIPMGIC
jgi:hypothetical protein